MDNHAELWASALSTALAGERPGQRELWLRQIRCAALSVDRLVLRADTRYSKEWFEDNYLEAVLGELSARLGRRPAVTFELPDPRAAEEPARAVPAPAATGGVTVAPPPPRGLNPRYTFDSFVVGPPNQFVYSVAQRVAASPGTVWNPLYIYGGVGLGKTHLLHAVGHEILRHRPDWNVVVVTCERWVRDLIGSLIGPRRQGANLMEEFRTRYRVEPDVLLVDDVQFLGGKDSSQDEFFHTFNALYQDQKQIVLTCDKLPGELNGIEDRLRSRFTWGITAESATPDMETRVAILQRKAAQDRLDLPEDVAHYVAAHIRSNVRELEGALARLFARSSIEGRTITLPFAVETLEKLIASSPPTLTIEGIQREVATYFDVKLHDLKGQRRHRAIAHPRMIAMYLCRKMTSMSFPEIGSRFGGKDHSTVISAVRKIDRQQAGDPALRSVLATLEQHLRQR